MPSASRCCLTCYSLAKRNHTARLSMQHNKISTLQLVRWTPHPYPIPVQHVRVDHRRTHVRMAEELLNRPDVVAVLQEVRREGMAEGVAGRVLRNPGGAYCGLDGAFVQMVSSDLAGLRIPVATMGRKDPLPTELRCPRGRLLLERAGELD